MRSMFGRIRRAFPERCQGSHTRRGINRDFGVETLERRALLSVGALDPSFGAGGVGSYGLATGAQAWLSAIVPAPGGKFVGLASTYRDEKTVLVARFFDSGAPDPSFGAGLGMVTVPIPDASEPEPLRAAVQPLDNKTLVLADDFFDGATLFRLNPDGSRDRSFGTDGYVTTFAGANREFRDFALQPDGKIVLGGWHVEPTDSSRQQFYIARLLPSGDPDPSFGGGDGWTITNFSPGLRQVSGIAVLPDGDIVAAGPNYDPVSGTSTIALARFNPDGTPDTSFGSGDGRIGDTGEVTTPFTTAGRVVARPDGRIYVSGRRQTGAGIARFLSDGRLDSTYDGDGVSAILFPTDDVAPYDLGLHPDGSAVLVGFTRTSFNALYTNAFAARFAPDGAQSQVTWVDYASRSNYEAATAVIARPDGRFLVGASSPTRSSIYGDERLVFRAYLANGQPDTSFGPPGGPPGNFPGGVETPGVRGTYDVASDAFVQPDGKVVVLGPTEAMRHGLDNSLYVNGGVVRFNSDGTPDTTFGRHGRVVSRQGFESPVQYRTGVALPGGKLLVAGSYGVEAGARLPVVTRLNGDGSVDNTFGTDGSGSVSPTNHDEPYTKMALQPGGRVLMIGRTSVTRMNANGTFDSSFGTGGTARLGNFPVDLEILPDGRFYVVSRTDPFSPDEPAPGPNDNLWLGRFTADGRPDPTFGNSGLAITVPYRFTASGLAVDADGNVLVSGTALGIMNPNSEWFPVVARVRPDGRMDESFSEDGHRQLDFPTRGRNWAADVAPDADGRIVVTGHTRPVNAWGDPVGGGDVVLARLNPDGSDDRSFGPGGVRAYDLAGADDRAARFLPAPAGRLLVAGSAVSTDGFPVANTWSDYAVLRVMTDGVWADAGGPYTVPEGADFALHGIGGTSAGRSAVSWEWDFNYDGTTFTPDATGQDATLPGNLLDGPSARTVALRVTDSAGDVAVRTAAVTVNNVAPTLTVTASPTGEAGVPYTLNVSSTDPGADSLTWTVNWRDFTGVSEAAGRDATLTHTYADGKNLYGIEISARDEDGVYWHEPHVVLITGGVNDAPTFNGSGYLSLPTVINENRELLLLGGFNPVDTGDRHRVVVSWGDGTPDSTVDLEAGDATFVARHTYRDDGPSGTPQDVYRITVTVTDDAATPLSGIRSADVTVLNLAPTVDIGSDRTINEATPVTFTPTVTDPGPDDTLTYLWRAHRASGAPVAEGTSREFIFTPADNGSYFVTLTVTDDDGGVASDSAGLTVNDVPPVITVAVPPTVPAGSPLTVNFSATDVPADPITGWRVTWGDGQVSNLPGDATSATHTYAGTPLTYLVSVQAINDDGTFRAYPNGVRPGTLDPTFGAGGKANITSAYIYDAALQPDGKLVAVMGGPPDPPLPWAVARYNADGSLDTSFGTNGFVRRTDWQDLSSTAVALQPDGRMIVVGFDNDDAVLARYLPDGSPDPSFGSAGYSRLRFGTADINRLYEVAVLPDGKIVTAGTIGMRSGSVDYDLFTARFNPDGSVDTTFGTGGRSPAIDVGTPANHAPTLLVQSDGKLVVGGGRGGTTSQSFVQFALGRFTTDGLLDPSFGIGGVVFTNPPAGVATGGFARFRGLAQAPDGSIVAVGNVGGMTAAGDYVVARYRPDGALDTTFRGGGLFAVPRSGHDEANAVLVTPDSFIYVAGTGETTPGTSGFTLTRLGPTGTTDTSFGADGMALTPMSFVGIPGGTRAGRAQALLMQPDGKFLSAGFGGMVRYEPGAWPVRVTRVGPDANVGPDRSVPEAAPTTLTAPIAGPGETLTYHWRVTADNGQVVPEGTARSFTFTPVDNGTYTVALTVTDAAGLSNTDSAVLTAYDVAPTMTVTPAGPAAEGAPFTLRFSAADAAPDTVSSWTINWGDGSPVQTLPGTATEASHLYDDGTKTYYVTVVATDEDGQHVLPMPGPALDPTFGNAGRVVGGSSGWDVALLPGGKFVTASGGILNESGWFITGFNAGGSPDPTFGRPSGGTTRFAETPPGFATSRAIVAYPGGKFIVAGSLAPSGGGQARPVAARYNADGTLDTTFGTGGVARLADFGNIFNQAAVLPDGKILAAGVFFPVNGTIPDLFVARFNADGSLDTTFGTGGRTEAVDFDRRHDVPNAIVLLPDGSFVVGGNSDREFAINNTNPNLALAKFTPDGRLDGSFGTGGKVMTVLPGARAWMRDLALLPDGRLLAAGVARPTAGTATTMGVLARYLPDGTLDTSFSGDGVVVYADQPEADEFNALVLRPDGRFIVGGTSGGRNLSLFGFLPDGSVDLTVGTGGKLDVPFTNSSFPAANAMALLPDHRILAIGVGAMARFTPAALPVAVANVAPTARFFADGPSVRFADASDVSAADTAAGFRYGFDFNNDGDFNDAELGEVLNATDPSRAVPALPPGVHIVRGRVRDKDLGFTDYTTTVLSAGVAGRHLFYNRSAFDGRDGNANAKDDGAIATDKAALLPGQAASAANVSGYDRGINGIMVDLAGAAEGLSAEDFEFHVGTGAEGGAWSPAPAPLSVTRRAGAGASGSDRVTLVWRDGAIKNQWLRVTVKANANTGLSAPDVFYVGSLPGETSNAPSGTGTGAAWRVNALDVAATRAALSTRPVGVTNRFDHNRDGRVNALDVLSVRQALGGTLTVFAAPPAATETDADEPGATDAVLSTP